MVIRELAVLLAGLVFVHASQNVSDLPKGELPVPLWVSGKDGQRRLLRCEVETEELAITNGKAAVVNPNRVTQSPPKTAERWSEWYTK